MTGGGATGARGPGGGSAGGRPPIRIRRVYDPPGEDDGTRVLVDRIWPRGVKREKAALDAWLPEVAPSPELRRWFGHRPERWPEFRRRYLAELDSPTPAAARDLGQLRALARSGPLTLLYGARDREHNQARVLREWLQATLDRASP